MTAQMTAPTSLIPFGGTCDNRFETVRAAFERNFTHDNEVGAAVAGWVDGDLVVNLWGGHADALRRLLGEGLAVTDAEAAAAVRFAFEVLKLVLEPGGAVALAAVLSGKIETQGKAIGVIASGGNCDPDLYARILRREI